MDNVFAIAQSQAIITKTVEEVVVPYKAKIPFIWDKFMEILEKTIAEKHEALNRKTMFPRFKVEDLLTDEKLQNTLKKLRQENDAFIQNKLTTYVE